MLVLKGNPDGIKGFEDLAGKNVGCEKGTTQADALAALNERFKSEGKPEMTINEFPDQPAALLAVQSGKIVCRPDRQLDRWLHRCDDRRR